VRTSATIEEIISRMSTLIEQFRQSSPLFGGNAAFIEELYESFLADPESVSDQLAAVFPRTWRRRLKAPAMSLTARFATPSRAWLCNRKPAWARAQVLSPQTAEKAGGGVAHHQRLPDPRAQSRRSRSPEIAQPAAGAGAGPGYHGLSEADMAAAFNTGSLVAPSQWTCARS
jgi:2-oxoglutarate dehydrogenase E1 component